MDKTVDAAPDDRLLHAASFMALFCVGAYAGAFGPSLPFIADDAGVSLDTAGLVLTTLFFGSITMSALVAVRLHRVDARALILAGLGCAALGSLGVGFAPAWALILASGAVLGAGDGLMVAATHILVSRTYKDVPSGINRLNLFFGFGAVAGPLWAGAVLAATDERGLVYAGIAVALAATGVVMALADVRVHRAIADERAGGFMLNRVVLVMGAVLFLYVGAEFGLGAWVSSYTRETADAGVMAGAALSAGYWLALTLGRIVSEVYFARGRDATAILAVSIAGAGTASLVLALASGSIALSAVAAFAAGLCLGPIWPSTVAIAAGGSSAEATATTVTLGNAGGLAIPWLQGKLLVGAGPGQGVALTAALCAVMLAILAGFRASERRR